MYVDENNIVFSNRFKNLHWKSMLLHYEGWLSSLDNELLSEMLLIFLWICFIFCPLIWKDIIRYSGKEAYWNVTTSRLSPVYFKKGFFRYTRLFPVKGFFPYTLNIWCSKWCMLRLNSLFLLDFGRIMLNSCIPMPPSNLVHTYS